MAAQPRLMGARSRARGVCGGDAMRDRADAGGVLMGDWEETESNRSDYEPGMLV